MKRESGPTVLQAEESIINYCIKIYIFASVWNVLDVIWQIFNLMSLSLMHRTKFRKAKRVDK